MSFDFDIKLFSLQIGTELASATKYVQTILFYLLDNPYLLGAKNRILFQRFGMMPLSKSAKMGEQESSIKGMKYICPFQ